MNPRIQQFTKLIQGEGAEWKCLSEAGKDKVSLGTESVPKNRASRGGERMGDGGGGPAQSHC